MKIITFLGTRTQSTEYSLYSRDGQPKGQPYTGKVFAEVLYKLLEFDQMLVFVTKEAKTKSFPVLEALDDNRIVPVEIPIGENAGEMWQIFEELTSRIDDNDEVSFDITHGLRSIPFLVFLAAAFLKSAKQVKIRSIYYGAFELQQDSQGNSRPAPIIDLSEFVTLLDWLNASEQFRRFGNASELAAQLRRVGSDPSLDNAAEALEKVSRSLRLILPDQAMKASKELQESLNEATEAIEQSARPFAVLSQQVKDSYEPLALDRPRSRDNLLSSLDCERRIIRWYLKRDLLVQAVTLAREWVISWCMVHAGYTHEELYRRYMRVPVEEELGTAAKTNPAWRDLRKTVNTDHRWQKLISVLPKARGLWSKLTSVRNTLLHAGKSASQRDAEALDERARQVCKSLDNLQLPESEMSR